MDTPVGSFTSIFTTCFILSALVAQVQNEENVCSSCDIINDVYPNCETSTTCSGEAPYCMTSFSASEGSSEMSKGCASYEDCQTQWWDSTRHEADCMDVDPYSWSGEKTDECHYCCTTPENEVTDWCNRALYPVMPDHLLDMGAVSTIPTTVATTTTSTTQSTKTPTTVPQTTIAPTTEAQTTKAPTTEDQTTNAPMIEAQTSIGTSSSSEADTTTASTVQQTEPTMTAAQTSSEIETETTTEPITLPPESLTTSQDPISSTPSQQTEPLADPLRCEVCDDGVCSSGAIEVCSTDTPYCLNTLSFTFNEQGDMVTSTEKSCADLDSCMSSNINNELCYGDLTDPDLAALDIRCNYCCNDTDLSLVSGLPCNYLDKPDNPISFLPEADASLSCVQCGDLASGEPCGALDLLYLDAQVCPSDLLFCMNDLYVTDQTAAVYKRCVDEETCIELWVDESAQDSGCTSYDPEDPDVSDLTCHFCCKADGCNKPTKPADDTLWWP